MNYKPEAGSLSESNFKIQSHPSITNDIIDFDVKCQRAISLNNSIPMFDLDAYVRPRLPDSVIATIMLLHLSASTSQNSLSRLRSVRHGCATQL